MMNVKIASLAMALALISVSVAAPTVAAPDKKSCSMTNTTPVDGVEGGTYRVQALYRGIDDKVKMEGRYYITVKAAMRNAKDAPAEISLYVNHLAEGTPRSGEKGFRSLVIKVPGITGTGPKGLQPSVELTSGPVALGTRKISPEGDVLFQTHKSGIGKPTIEGMDLDKRLNLGRSGLDISVKSMSGSELARYTVTGDTLKEMSAAMYDGYGKLWPAVQNGDCETTNIFGGFS